MSKLKVTDPKGIHFGDKFLEKGATFEAARPFGAHVNTFLHFKQVEEVIPKDAPKEPGESAADKKAREKAEAEAAKKQAADDEAAAKKAADEAAANANK